MAVSLAGTRLSILQHLQLAGEATVDSLANKLGLASATVRRHLDILQRDRLVSFVEVRKSAGRPEHSFSLTEIGHEALPKAYDHFLSLLLKEISRLGKGSLDEKDGKQIMRFLLERMGRHLAKSYGPSDEVSPRGRFDRLVHTLEERGFSPEVQLGGGSAILLVHNCPFRSIARQVGQVCLFDHEFISTLLDAPVERTHCISGGDAYCCYRVAL